MPHLHRSSRRVRQAALSHAALSVLDSLETRVLLSAAATFNWPQKLPASEAPAAALSVAAASQVLTLHNQVHTAATLPDTTVTMTGRSELRITAASTPITGSVIHLNSPDAWVFFTNIKPSVVNSTYRSQIFVNGAPAVHGSNVRIVQHELGTVVIPHAPSYQPFEAFTGPNFTGVSQSFGQYTYFDTTGELGQQHRNMSSFKLKRGYMATIATQANGSGSSKVYVAQDHDLDVSLLPANLDNAVQYVYVLPWRWVSKKGVSDYSPTPLNAAWNYNWNNDQTSSLDHEYVPIRQQRWWPGYPYNKPDSTHLLGFNEPNNPVEDAYESLGNGSIDTAIAVWPELMSTGLRLGSPAVTDGGKAWLYEFMDKAIAANLRVDFIAIHNYQAGNTATSLYNWLKDIYDRYHLPIWITEFNNGANWTGGADPTYEQNAAAISSFIEMFDNTPWIERYSIYGNVEDVRDVNYPDGSLTPMGIAYRDNASPIAYIQDPVPSTNSAGRSIAQLPLDGNALDTSGYGHNGQIVGGPNFVAGQRGQALQLDGASTFVRLPGKFPAGDAFSFAAWVNWDGGASWQRAFDFGNGTNQYLFLTPSNGSNMRFVLKNGGAEQIIQTAPLPIGQWTHVAVTLGGGTARLYVNGVLAATGAVSIRPGDFDPTINYLGKSQFAADPLFKGRLDDVLITDYALSAAQVSALMTDTPPQFTAGTILRGPAARGVSFSGTVAGTAADGDAGDGLTYGKAHGPAWLNVAADGTLSGTPTLADQFPQDFVITVTDSAGATSFAILSIDMIEWYWRGDVNNSWATNSAGNTNWATNVSGMTDVGQIPTESADVVFSANNAANLPTTVLGADFSVRSLRVSGAAGATIGGMHNLTLGADGFAVISGAGPVTINTSGQVILGANQTWTINRDTTVASAITGSAGLTKTGTSALTLTGNNVFTGGTTITAGALLLGNGGTGGSLVGNVLNNGALVINRSNNLTLSGLISGTGTLEKLGAGTLTLSSTNTFSGSVTIGSFGGAGVLRATAHSALGSGAVLIGPNGNATTARLELSNNVALANAITLPMRNNTTPAVQNISGNNTLSGAIALQVGGSSAIFQSDAGTLTLAAISSAATGARPVTLTGSGHGTAAGVISNGSGTLAVTKGGIGTWTLNAANTYTGDTTVTLGTLALGGADRIANASNLVLNGGTFSTGGFNETLGTLSLAANSSINFAAGNSTLTFSAPGTFTAGRLLNILNWTPGTDRLFVGNTASLTAAQLAQISFNGTAAMQLATGEVVPAPDVLPPTVAAPAAAAPNPVTGTTTALSVLGSDNAGESNLTYTWSATGPGAVTYSANGSNAAKNTTATFSAAGNYNFTVTITDLGNLQTTSSVSVTVDQTLTLSPLSPKLLPGTTQQMALTDQFGAPMAVGGVTWSASAGTISPNGLFTAPPATGSVTITADTASATLNTTGTVIAPTAWYKADTAGATLTDSSGDNHHGTNTGVYSTPAGLIANALTLSGGHAVLPTGIVSTLNDFTISTWVRLTSRDTWARLFDFGTGANVNMFLAPVASDGFVRFAITATGGAGEQRITTTTSLNINTWYHVAVTLSGTTARIYVNGVLAGTHNNMTLKPSSLGSTALNYLGKSQYPDPTLKGSIDDFRIYNAAVSANGIAALYAAGNAAASSAPSSVLATVPSSGPQVDVTWNDNSGVETAYLVERATDASFSTGLTSVLLPANTASYADTTVAAGASYYYRVTALLAGNTATAAVAAPGPVTPNLPPVPGDANNDRKVDAFDLNLLAANWQAETPGGISAGDFNIDGKVDAFDLNILAAHWQEGVSLAAGQTAEPFFFAPLAPASTTASTSAMQTEPGTEPTTSPIVQPSTEETATSSTLPPTSDRSTTTNPVRPLPPAQASQRTPAQEPTSPAKTRRFHLLRSLFQ